MSRQRMGARNRPVTGVEVLLGCSTRTGSGLTAVAQGSRVQSRGPLPPPALGGLEVGLIMMGCGRDLVSADPSPSPGPVAVLKLS